MVCHNKKLQQPLPCVRQSMICHFNPHKHKTRAGQSERLKSSYLYKGIGDSTDFGD